MKKVAIITGASSGMGRCFAETIGGKIEFDELWVIARRADRLEKLKEELPFPVRPVQLDLSDRAGLSEYEKLLASENPDIVILIQCSGFGKFCATTDVSVEENLNMLDLNCGAVLALSQMSLPYMHEGARIVNFASEAAFQPTPYINVYAATKAFVLSYSRALNRELKGRGISVTAVCPFWTKTEFFGRAIAKDGNPVVKRYACMYDPKDIVNRAWRDALARRDVSKYGFTARFQALLAKLMPHSLIMSAWMAQQGMK